MTEFTANLSVPTLDEKAWRDTEPHTPHPRKRLEAVAELNRAGIPTSVLIAPLIPGVNDAPEQVEEILELAGEAGAHTIGGVGLHLRGEVREIWFDWLRQYRPDLIPATRSCTGVAPTCRAPSVSDWRTWRGAATGFAAPGASASEKPTSPSPGAAVSPPPKRQSSLF